MNLARTPAELIWCGASAPVIQGLMIGIGAIAVGLVAFPFAVTLSRPMSGRQSEFARARGLVRWTQRLAIILAFFSTLTVSGYVYYFVAANGRFCNSKLSPDNQLGIDVWGAVSGLTVVLAATSSTLRWLARRSLDSHESKPPMLN